MEFGKYTRELTRSLLDSALQMGYSSANESELTLTKYV